MDFIYVNFRFQFHFCIYWASTMTGTFPYASPISGIANTYSCIIGKLMTLSSHSAGAELGNNPLDHPYFWHQLQVWGSPRPSSDLMIFEKDSQILLKTVTLSYGLLQWKYPGYSQPREEMHWAEFRTIPDLVFPVILSLWSYRQC